MRVHFALEPFPKSIFLAGPTPRDAKTPSWRPEALRILEDELAFSGTVLVPETRDWAPHNEKNGQVHWEWEALNQATVIAFWVPRNLKDMPALTTNVEFGMFANSGKLVLGYPPEAPKMLYLNNLATRYRIPTVSTLRGLLELAVSVANQPFGGDFDASKEHLTIRPE
jgi:hypothetical protein